MGKKVFILGGTGFLGYYTTRELLDRGYSVSTMALPPMPTDDLLPEEVECTLGDINEMSDQEIIDMLDGVYGFIYAAGADERVVPKKPAISFFYEANCLLTQRIARLCVEAGVEKFVLFNSYFAEFAVRWPETGLKDQPYPNTRLLQEQLAFAEGEGKMDVTSLRLPYIFGTMPGRMPLWEMYTDQLTGLDVFPVLKGGTAAVTVEQVAESAVGAMEFGKHRDTFPISSYDLSFEEFFTMMVDALGEDIEVPVLPYEEIKENYEALDEQAVKDGLEYGMKNTLAAQLQERDMYVDKDLTQSVLKFKDYDMKKSIEETLKKCVEKE